MIRYASAAALSLLVSVLVVPLIIKTDKKLKIGQPILTYVDNHSSKSGTPTFGGVAIVLAAVTSVLVFAQKSSTLAIMCAVITSAYAIVGFIDDFIKAKSKHNEGLTALQKIVFQAFIAVIISTYAYSNAMVGDKLILPFSLRQISLGWLAIPYYILIFVAFTNAVNLTDGLDGLAGKTSVAYFIAFTVLLYIVSKTSSFSQIKTEEVSNLILFAVCLIFATIGFLFYNSYPAKIFMGDTGSLALGGAIGSLAVFSNVSLYSPLLGITFVFTCISDVVQVVHYKRTKRRIFLMAPFHHHLERKGMHENKIVSLYTAVTMFVGLACIILTLV